MALKLERLELETDDGVALVWLNRPELRNAFDGQMVTELRAVLDDLTGSDAVRVVVLGGRGKVFSAGADLEWMKAVAAFGREENVREARAMADLFFALYSSPKPVVARVHGRETPFGAFLDSVLDRYADASIFLALGWRFLEKGQSAGAVLSVVTMVGALLVSYARARAEGIGTQCTTGIMERPERIILLALGCVTGWILPILWIIVVLTHVTVVQRIVAVAKGTRPSG